MKEIMLTVQNLSYSHPDKNPLFTGINLNVNPNEKIALIGNNGAGKTTLLRIIAGELHPSDGILKTDTSPCYIPQIFGQYNHLTVAEALGVNQKLRALHEILHGNVSEKNYELLSDDWTVEERCAKALHEWQLNGTDLSRKMETLSGGQKTKVFLAGISIHQPELVLLDEPSNHLDISGRRLLYDFVRNTHCTLIVVSHDRRLLNCLNMTCELDRHGITVYGGNYDFYREQKRIRVEALSQEIQSREKALKKAREKERETLERQRKLDSRAKKNQVKAGLPRIVANTRKNSAEKSTAKIESVHAEKTGNLSRELQELRSSLPEAHGMKVGFDRPALHGGKILFTADGINHRYGSRQGPLWSERLSLRVASGERIAVKGANGSGKTTLINIILGNLTPQTGVVTVTESRSVYIDQDYSLINNGLKIYAQAQRFNTSALLEHKIKIRLNRFQFPKEEWDKPCSALSGGERMRLMLCCLSIADRSPDIIVLDEPTNNLDIRNIKILTEAVSEYRGTLLVISHDESFLEQIHIQRVINLKTNPLFAALNS
jgi:ATPase subunit of ABC transporter with duplicated ATPase domains